MALSSVFSKRHRPGTGTGSWLLTHPRPPDACAAGARPQCDRAAAQAPLLVDVAAFLQSLSGRSCFGHSLAARQVYQAHLTDLLSGVLVGEDGTTHVSADADVQMPCCD